jgi:hypothetical protein
MKNCFECVTILKVKYSKKNVSWVSNETVQATGILKV